MELVDDVIALQSQVKTLENQVKVLQQAQKPASITKSVPSPPVDIKSLKAELRAEWIGQLNRLQAEVNQLKAQIDQYQALPVAPVKKPVDFKIDQIYIALTVIIVGFLLWWVLSPSQSDTTATIPTVVPTPMVGRVATRPVGKSPRSSSNRGHSTKAHPQSGLKSTREEQDEALKELEAWKAKRDSAKAVE